MADCLYIEVTDIFLCSMLIRKIRLTALFFLAVLAVPVSVSADGIDVGIRVGLNSVTNNIKAVGSPSGGGSDRYTGFFAGPVLDIHLPAFFSIDLSALYSHKGLQLPDENNFIMQAIALPVMAKFTFPLGESVGLLLRQVHRLTLILANWRKYMVPVCAIMSLTNRCGVSILAVELYSSGISTRLSIIICL